MLKKTIYAELRDILDTRLTTISLLDKELAKKAVTDEVYINRIYEEYDYLGYDILKYYRNLNLEQQLTESFASKVLELISVELNLLLSKLVQADDDTLLTLEINTYPYELSEITKNKLANAISLSILNEYTDIQFIYIKPTELTLTYVDNKYEVMFMYDGLEWLEYHISLLDGQAVDTKLYIPSMLMKPIEVKKEKDLEAILQSLDELYKPYINVTNIPVEFFHIRSMYIKAFLDKNS